MKNRKANSLHTITDSLRDNVKISTLAYYPISTFKQRFLWVAAFLLMFSLGANAQSLLKILLGPEEDKDKPVQWLRTEKSVGVVPEIDFVNGGMGISLSRGKFIRGTHNAMAGTSYYAGYSYITDYQISAAAFGASAGMFRKKFGGQFSIKGIYYVNKREQVFAIRPEGGIGFPKMQLNYGYNFFTEKTEMKMPVHTLTLYVYFAVYSNRVNMY